jgi:hypothetical protein
MDNQQVHLTHINYTLNSKISVICSYCKTKQVTTHSTLRVTLYMALCLQILIEYTKSKKGTHCVTMHV